MTREEAIQKFREMWEELSITGESKKLSTALLQDEIFQIFNDCYLCEYSKKVYEKNINYVPENSKYCIYCPIEWPVDVGCLITSFQCEKRYFDSYDYDKLHDGLHNGLYALWCDAEFEEDRKKIALQISQLPERK